MKISLSRRLDLCMIKDIIMHCPWFFMDHCCRTSCAGGYQSQFKECVALKPYLQERSNLEMSHSGFALIAAGSSDKLSFLPVIGEAAGTEPADTRLTDICAIRSDLKLLLTDVPAFAAPAVECRRRRPVWRSAQVSP